MCSLCEPAAPQHSSSTAAPPQGTSFVGDSQSQDRALKVVTWNEQVVIHGRDESSSRGLIDRGQDVEHLGEGRIGVGVRVGDGYG